MRLRSRAYSLEMPKADRSLEASQKRLRKGITAIKFNYSNTGIKNVIIKLSKDLKTLEYQKVEKDKNLWDKIKGSSKLALNQIAGISYGGTTSTFYKMRKTLVRSMAVERAPLQNFYDHYDKRRKVRLLKEGNELVWNQETKFTKPD